MWRWLSQQVTQNSHRLIIVLAVTGSVIGIQLTGGLQLVEWAMLDAWFRLRPPEGGTSRVVIVTISEADISRLNWPLDDATLATLLQKLQQQQPEVVGLDLYRNLPVEPGHQKLRQVYATMPNLIGIAKVVPDEYGPAVQPPPVLSDRDQVAMSDLVLDPDGKVRRNLLSVRPSQGKSLMSLGAKAAIDYLAKRQIVPQPQGNQIYLGRATLSPLQANDGGYVRADVGGYQMLANFYRARALPAHIAISDVLADRVPAGLMTGRIVLIGSTATSLGDRFYTPYTTDMQTAWAGVDIHANVADQLLSAAIEGRQLLRGVPVWAGWGWIVLWVSVGCSIGAAARSVRSASWRTGAALLTLVGSAYLGFLAGWWISLIAPLLGLASAGLVSRGYAVWQTLQRSHQALEDYAKQLEFRVQERTQQLVNQNRLLAAAKQHAESADHAKTRFLANINHELRTPLTIILGCSELLSFDPLIDDKQREKLHSIDRSVHYLLGLINNVLDLAKLEVGAVSINLTTFDLWRLLDNLETMFQHQAAIKGLQLRFDRDPTLPHYIETDERKLNQVLINLLSNAVKFTATGSVSLRVSATPASSPPPPIAARSANALGTLGKTSLPDRLCFEVSDTGVGIAAHELSQLFAAFVQTESGKQSSTGTGLGLSISRQFVQLLGSDIQVASQVGQGSRFWFELPVKVLSASPVAAVGILSAFDPTTTAITSMSQAPVDRTGLAAAAITQSSAALANLPKTWVAELNQAALRLNAEKCLKLIHLLPAHDAQLSQTLQALVKDFRFDVIAQITED